MNNVSVIITVRNEEKNIVALLESLVTQTQLPSEIIITDAQSSDTTVQKIQEFAQQHKSIPIEVISRPGNRSAGRNAAIQAAKNQLIAVTDAGCIPKRKWLESLLAAYQHSAKEVPVISGPAVGVARSHFEEAVIPFFLIMPPVINPQTYLPTTRSMLIHKKRWEEVGGFDETFNTSEDFLFSNELKKAGVPMIYSAEASVEWFPPHTYFQALKTFASFAACDVAGGVVRPKVLVLFGRYLLGILCVVALVAVVSWLVAGLFTVTALIGYSLWTMWKHRRYVEHVSYWQPLLQFGADLTVMAGSLWGIGGRIFAPARF